MNDLRNSIFMFLQLIERELTISSSATAQVQSMPYAISPEILPSANAEVSELCKPLTGTGEKGRGEEDKRIKLYFVHYRIGGPLHIKYLSACKTIHSTERAHLLLQACVAHILLVCKLCAQLP